MQLDAEGVRGVVRFLDEPVYRIDRRESPQVHSTTQQAKEAKIASNDGLEGADLLGREVVAGHRGQQGRTRTWV